MVVCSTRSLFASSTCLGPAHQPRQVGHLADRQPAGARRRGSRARPCTCCRRRRGCAGRAARRRSARSGSARQPAQRLVLVPVGAEQVRAEVADHGRPPSSRATTSTTPSAKPTAVQSSVRSTTRASWAGPPPRGCPAGRGARSPPSSGGCAGCGPSPIRVSRCLPRATRAVDGRPGQVERGERRAPGSRCGSAPARSAPGRGAARCARRCRPQARRLPQPRSRSPRGVATKPAASSACRSGWVARRPRMLLAVGPLDGQPAQRALAYGGGERVDRRARGASASSVKVSSVRPPRST